MIIHKPKIEEKGTSVRISTYIEFEKKKKLSKNLWYEFDKEYKNHFSQNLDGFLSSMIMLAMYTKEDITIKGKISPKLSYGIKQLQNYFHFWYPDMFHKVKIIPQGYQVEKAKPKGVMCTFSGGVDAFYTLLNHLPKNEPNPYYQITHCLLIDGFAVPRNEKMNNSYNIIKNEYSDLISDLGLKLVFVKTNVAEFYHEKVVPCMLDGPMLAVVPLLLGNLISKFYIASCLSYAQMLPRGSNAITNNMLSTENLSVMIHGSDKSRTEKIVDIAGQPETLDNLRVCWEDYGVKNCCKCEKCIRTMLTLESAGVLKKYKTFPLPLTRKKVRNWRLEEVYNFWFANENIIYAEKKGRKDIVFDIKIAIFKNKIRNKFMRVLNFSWKVSAFLKKRSKLWTKFVKMIKNHN